MASVPAAVAQTLGVRPVSGMNAITGIGQTQPGASSDAIHASMQSVNKGGMRGLGLLAVAIAEVALKKKAVDLAKDYFRTNKKDYDFFRSNHQPMIQASVLEAMSGALNPYYNADLYASAPAGIAKASILDRQWYEARRRVSRYAIGIMQRLDYDYAIRRTHGVVAGWNLATRYELVWTDEHNNRAFERKLQVANIGVAQGNIVRQGLAAAVGNLSTAYDNIGDTVATIGNGWAAKGGYQEGRADTRQRYGAMR